MKSFHPESKKGVYNKPQKHVQPPPKIHKMSYVQPPPLKSCIIKKHVLH